MPDMHILLQWKLILTYATPFFARKCTVGSSCLQDDNLHSCKHQHCFIHLVSHGGD
jgi:hypothetical protein